MLANTNKRCVCRGLAAAEREVEMMPLTMADNGKLLKIQRITGTDEIKQHMATLGFVVGEEISIVNKNGGNLIVNVKDSRIALDKTLANRIMIG